MTDAPQVTPDVHYAETPYGFEFGVATITRMHHHKDGSVWINIETPKYPFGRGIQVHVTKTGKVKIYDGSVQWRKQP